MKYDHDRPFYWNEASKTCIGQNCLTNSKNPKSFVFGIYPTHALTAYDCRLVGADKKEYVDYICGLGVNIAGYGNHFIGDAIRERMANGFTWSLPSHYEVLFAEKIKSHFPVEKIKVLKSGSEGCSAAIRIARAYQEKCFGKGKRIVVLHEGYSG